MDDSLGDLAQWMTLLPDAIKHVPIINLAIPGKYKKSMQFEINVNICRKDLNHILVQS